MISALMNEMTFSRRTVARRWHELGLKASNATEASMDPEKIVELVSEEIEMDPDG